MKKLMKPRKLGRFSNGGEVDSGEFNEAGSGPSEDVAAPAASTAPAEPAAAPEYKSFKEAFAANRKAGAKTFEYKGKKYTTDMAPARKEVASPERTDSLRSQSAAPAEKPKSKGMYQRGFEADKARLREFLKDDGSAAAERAKLAEHIRNLPAGARIQRANGGAVKARQVAKSHGKAC